MKKGFSLDDGIVEAGFQKYKYVVNNRLAEVLSSIVVEPSFEDYDYLMVDSSYLNGLKSGDYHTIFKRRVMPENKTDIPSMAACNLNYLSTLYRNIADDESQVRRLVDRGLRSKSFFEVYRELVCGYWDKFSFIPSELVFDDDLTVPKGESYLFVGMPSDKYLRRFNSDNRKFPEAEEKFLRVI